jgi:trans-aconitate methyltransferase
MDEAAIDRQADAFWAQLWPILPFNADIPDGAVVTEFGCGWGRMTIKLASNYPRARINGIDMVPGAVHRARTLFPRIWFHCYDHYHKTVPVADLVVTCTCLQHITDTEVFQRVVQSFHSRILPGGWLVMLENATKKRRGTHLHDMTPADYKEAFDGFDFETPIIVSDPKMDKEDHFLLRGRRSKRTTAHRGEVFVP